MQPKTPQKSKEAPSLSANRDTATFTPYYWEAYNEITRPDRFDWYLVEKWQRDLGPIGFGVVKALRNLCYHNPKKGVTRDTCEVEMGELAESIGISRATLFREMERNEALKQFVRVQKQFAKRGNKIERAANLFQVCMDTPVHPSDMEEYDLLRCQKEADRNTPNEGKKYAVKPESQIEILVKPRESQIATRESQIETYGESQIETVSISLPSGSLYTKESHTPITGGVPPINPPVGEGEINPKSGGNSESGPDAVWSSVMEILQKQVEAGEINAPTFHGHLTKLRIVSITTDDDSVSVVLEAATAWSRDWVEKRHTDRLRAVLGGVLGRADGVTLTFNVMGK
jgi:hypothetical protein